MHAISFESLLLNAKKLAKEVSAEGGVLEEQRRLPPHIVIKLREIGVFRMNFPLGWGGLELTSPQQTQVIEQLAIGDAAVAWCAMIGSDSGIYSGFIDEPVARDMFTVDSITAGWIHPQGKAEIVPGGYRVSGRWRFGSGLSHCDILSAGCFVYQDGNQVVDRHGAPIWRVMMAKPDEYELHDNWHTTGLAGSGSRDYGANNMFVPYEHSFSFNEPYRKGPLHDVPDAILRNMAGIPLGMARAALDYAISLAEHKYDRSLSVSWKKSPRVQAVLARCEIELYSARCAVYSSLNEQWDGLVGKEPLSNAHRITVALARQQAFKVSRQIISTIYDLVGGASIYKNETPMDKWLRDSYTMNQHAVASESIVQQCGQFLLNNHSNNLFI